MTFECTALVIHLSKDQFLQISTICKRFIIQILIQIADVLIQDDYD